MVIDRRVPAVGHVQETAEQIGDSALVWYVIEAAFWVVYGADDPLDEDFGALTDGQRHVAVLNLVWAGMMNGGIYEPLYNSSGRFLPEAIEAARAIGAPITTRLLQGLVDYVGLCDADLRDSDVRCQALAGRGDDADLESLLEPAAEWFECAERFIADNRHDFFL